MTSWRHAVATLFLICDFYQRTGLKSLNKHIPEIYNKSLPVNQNLLKRYSMDRYVYTISNQIIINVYKCKLNISCIPIVPLKNNKGKRKSLKYNPFTNSSILPEEKNEYLLFLQ